MKNLLTTVWLSLGCSGAVAQAPEEPFIRQTPHPVSEFQIGYNRETYKMRDLQASPMLYVANLNGIRIAYTRLMTKNQWYIAAQAGLGDFIAPGLGIRSIKFSSEQEQPLWVVPTLYAGQVELDYHRLIQRTTDRTSWLGLGIRDSFGYADGLVLSTWALNTATLSVLYKTRLTLGRKHSLSAGFSLPLIAFIGRMPYSNVISEPNRSNASSFLSGSQWVTVNRFLNPQVGIGYRFELNQWVAFQTDYQYNWLRYTEPQLIRSATHRANLSVIYKFQWQTR
ncbi:hypothetical protein G8759_21875 [Spirosoma aureum]|uniref:Outer membrane beta-barrel protein n=1 Tax=Spirosoma aureum TaxID=2692134 RepID=A0A6G9ARG7_9BACT|nr:hypothetical protein [Spirosoma aureum]QIP15082.1 hypothetical protein G8759_21875 [Spirosoma aureum]